MSRVEEAEREAIGSFADMIQDVMNHTMIVLPEKTCVKDDDIDACVTRKVSNQDITTCIPNHSDITKNFTVAE